MFTAFMAFMAFLKNPSGLARVLKMLWLAGSSRGRDGLHFPRLEPLEVRLVLDSQTLYWTGASGTDLNWSNRLNWRDVNGILATRAPGINDTATFDNTSLNACNVDTVFNGQLGNLVITSGFTSEIDLERELDIFGSSSMAGGTVAGAFTLAFKGAAFNWSGGIIEDGVAVSITDSGGMTPQPGSITLSGSSDKDLDGAAIFLAGAASAPATMNWNSGNINVFENFTNFAYGIIASSGTTINLNCDATIQDQTGQGKVELYGANLIKNSGTGLTTFHIYVDLDARSDANITRGSIRLEDGSSISALVSVSATSALILAGGGGAHTLNGANVIGTGTTNFVDSAHVTVQGQSHLVNVYQSSGSLDGSGILDVSGVYNWYDGSWAGSGITLLSSGAQLIVQAGNGPLSLGRTLDNFGTVTWSSYRDIKVSNGANILNESGALFDIQVDNNITDGGGAGKFTNYAGAILRKSAGTGISSIAIPFTVPHAGRIEALSGTLVTVLSFQNIGILIVGDAGGDGGNFTAQNGFEQDGGTTTVNSGATLSVTGNVTQTGGTIEVSGADYVTGALEATGSFYESGGSVQILGEGELTAASFAQSAGTTVLGEAGGFDEAILNITGSFQESGGSIRFFDDAYAVVNNTLEQSGGTFTVDAEYTGAEITATNGFQIDSGVVFSAIGSVTIRTNNAVNNGTVSIGALNCPSGLTVMGNYTQASGAVLSITVDGPDPNYNRFVATSLATLTGTLNINLTGGYVPMIGDYFPSIVGYGSRSGAFSTVQPTLSQGQWQSQYYDPPVYSPGHLDLSVVRQMDGLQGANGKLGRPDLSAAAVLDEVHADTASTPTLPTAATDQWLVLGPKFEAADVTWRNFESVLPGIAERMRLSSAPWPEAAALLEPPNWFSDLEPEQTLWGGLEG